MKTKLLIITAISGLACALVRADTILLDFRADTSNPVTGGSLELLENGSGPTNSFVSDRFEGLEEASFQISGLSTYGDLTATATALLTDLNLTNSGLADSGSGYDGAGEGTSFVFDKDVTITFLDFASFTTAGSDSIILRNGPSNLGTFNEGTDSGGIDFDDPNNVSMSTTVLAGNAFELEHAGGTFDLEEISITVIPEPSSLALMGLTALAALGIFRHLRT